MGRRRDAPILWRLSVANKLVARSDALVIGATQYFTGKPCKNGHIAPRQVSNFRCIECRKEQWKKWAEADEVKQYNHHRFREG
jgi:hypothetical protein